MSFFRPSMPKMQTVLLSLLFVIAGMLGATLSPELAEYKDWFLLFGYVILLAGVFLKNV